MTRDIFHFCPSLFEPKSGSGTSVPPRHARRTAFDSAARNTLCPRPQRAERLQTPKLQAGNSSLQHKTPAAPTAVPPVPGGTLLNGRGAQSCSASKPTGNFCPVSPATARIPLASLPSRHRLPASCSAAVPRNLFSSLTGHSPKAPEEQPRGHLYTVTSRLPQH